MGRYELRFKTSVAKDLRGMAKAEVKRLLVRIEALRDDPKPAGVEKLSGHELYRVRQGVYRIVYRIEEAHVIVEVIKIGHRREVYRKL